MDLECQNAPIYVKKNWQFFQPLTLPRNIFTAIYKISSFFCIYFRVKTEALIERQISSKAIYLRDNFHLHSIFGQNASFHNFFACISFMKTILIITNFISSENFLSYHFMGQKMSRFCTISLIKSIEIKKNCQLNYRKNLFEY